MRLQDYDTSQRFQATVLSSDRLTPADSPDEVREIILEIGVPEFEAAAGQSIGVLAPGREEFGQKHHLRLYSVADLPAREGGAVRFPICVKRCSYVDEFSGERYQGVASNYLCDLREGDTLSLCGPYGLAFPVPADPEATLILIGAGTGIAPFRAFVKHLYHNEPDFEGCVRLFHGGRTGLELLYMNEEQNDFAQYYDHDTFEAVAALSARPYWSGQVDWASALEPRGDEILEMLPDPRTHVYLAGLEPIRDELEAVFAQFLGSEEKWAELSARLKEDGRWIELLY